MKDRILRLLRAAAKAYKEFKSGFRLGADDKEAFSAVLRSLENSLGQYCLQYDYLCGADSAKTDGITQNYVPAPGDAVLMDLSVGKDGVWCDVCRTFFVGYADRKQREDFAALKGALRAGEKVLRAGARAEDVFGAVNGALGGELVHHAGHLFGTGPLMPPRFMRGERAVLEEGSFATLEPGLYRKNFGIRIENDYFIGGNAENLFEGLMPLELEDYILQ